MIQSLDGYRAFFLVNNICSILENKCNILQRAKIKLQTLDLWTNKLSHKEKKFNKFAEFIYEQFGLYNTSYGDDKPKYASYNTVYKRYVKAMVLFYEISIQIVLLSCKDKHNLPKDIEDYDVKILNFPGQDVTQPKANQSNT
jgi:hypothetical protein